MGDARDGLTSPPKLVVFDLDGTLIDSRRDLVKCVNATLEHFGRSDLPAVQVASYIGDGAAQLVRRSMSATGKTDEPVAAAAVAYFLKYYQHHLLDHTHVYRGTLEALAALRAAAPHLLMAVLTNKSVRPSRQICDVLGISPFFFANYGGDSFATKKPDPTGLLHLIADAGTRLGMAVSATETVMVGDSDVDIHTARAAGTRSIGCLYGFAPEGLRASNPDTLVSAPSEWAAALGLSS